jgi:hypothetical protein
MSNVAELFGTSTNSIGVGWEYIVQRQICPFLEKKCYKVRKSDPETAIGTCTMFYGKGNQPVIICPTRFLERRQVFIDAIHLLTTHQPGNELHVVSEVSVPGGHVDYFLVSVRDGRVQDFVGIELQALDTTGTIWPERQRFLRESGLSQTDDTELSGKPYGINWKMTAKTILMQLHHKIDTFEHVNRKLVLVVQDRLLEYMRREFNFTHLREPAIIGDSMHLHVYQMTRESDGSLKITMRTRLSTDSHGIANCLDLQAEARVELKQILELLQAKISSTTRFTLV